MIKTIKTWFNKNVSHETLPFKIYRGKGLLKRDIISKVLLLEKTMYPEYMCTLNEAYNESTSKTKNLLEFFEVDELKHVHLLLGDTWYLLYSKVNNEIEIIDYCGTNSPVFAIFKYFKQFKNCIISGDFRHSTSYRIVRCLEYSKKIEILSSSSWYWDDDRFHNIEFKVL